MKPPPFEYRAPASVEEALPLLGPDSVVLAGGQSLVPLLNLRLARPEVVVDINGIAELDYIRTDGVLRIGAMTRQVALERSELLRGRWPLLHKAVRLVGHPQIRTRGTVGGSVAHADPAAELPVALTALGASFHLRSAAGARVIGPSEFFVGPLYTAREPDELLVEVEVPERPEGERSGFAEYARTHGDFATAGAAAVVAPGGHARIALLGAGPVPVRAEAAERALGEGAEPSDAAELAVQDLQDEHRRALCAELVRRAIEEAIA
ncbi:MAG TPA: xanthine dehydrogenase family protein subunit M [Thermoleophilaceae bacterium]|nr:xanthine dehydrogenase family protein subunit M [Thermoleophilaceae bacterium]